MRGLLHAVAADDDGPRRAAGAVDALRRILAAAAALDVEAVTVPFVDASAIRTPEEMAAVEEAFGELVPVASDAGIRLALETALAPRPFRALLDRLRLARGSTTTWATARRSDTTPRRNWRCTAIESPSCT